MSSLDLVFHSARRFMLAAALGLPTAALAATATVVGVPHLSNLEPGPDAGQLDAALDRLEGFAPTLVCIESVPGERVAEFVRQPAKYGELLRIFALDAVRLAPEQQLRLGMDAAAAAAAAQELARADTLDATARIRLVSLQLAAHEPWSAVLNWSALGADERASAVPALGRVAAERLDALLGSQGEVAMLAIPLARRAGHRRLCHADPFVDELAVQELEADLLPLLSRPGLMDAVNAFHAGTAGRWKAGRPEQLLDLLRWTNSDGYAARDRQVQWDIFAEPADHAAGNRRLMLWHARNAAIATRILRGLAASDGARVMLLIGAAHRPFVEAALRAQPWLEVVPAMRVLEPDATPQREDPER
jgi:hypothetical protein